jgi:hypothetical protein
LLVSHENPPWFGLKGHEPPVDRLGAGGFSGSQYVKFYICNFLDNCNPDFCPGLHGANWAMVLGPEIGAHGLLASSASSSKQLPDPQ